MNKQYTMIGIGEILWDELPQGRQLGGAPANFACHCCQLGNKGVVISSVGNDPDGEEIFSVLERKRIGQMLTRSDNHPTGTVSVVMSSGGKPGYTIHENVAWDYICVSEEHLAVAGEADVICYGSLAQRNAVSAQATSRMLAAVSEQCIRIFDVNLRQHYFSKAIISSLLEASTVLKLNDEELETVAAMFSLEGDEDQLLQQFCANWNLNLVILTKGGAGSRLFSREMGDSTHEVIPVQVVDTVGAGDSFTAAIATGLCRGLPLEQIHRLAGRVAAFVCSRQGATPRLPPIAELMKDS